MTETTHDSERESIDIALGEGATIDGGPFENVEVTGVEYDENGHLLVTYTGGEVEVAMRVSSVENALQSEIEGGEPIFVNGIDPNDTEASVTLPLANGMDVQAGGYIMTAEALRLGNVPDEYVEHVENSDVEYFPQ